MGHHCLFWISHSRTYLDSTSRHGNESSPITGFFINPAPGEVIVRRWDAKEERLVKLLDGTEEERYQLAVKNFDFDCQLGAYDIHCYRVWKQLTAYIDSSTLERLEPVGGDISVIAEATFADGHTAPEDKGKSSGRCFYTSIPHLVKCPGVSGSELTALNVDKSVLLETVLEQHYGCSEDAILGELQFSFVAFLMGQSLESFGQWKAIVSLMLSCEAAPLRRRTQLFIKFLELVYFELKTGLKPDNTANGDSPSLDASWLLDDNFLQLLYKDFFLMVREAQHVDGGLLKQARRLKNFLESSFSWVLEDENFNIANENEYAPTVVEEAEIMEQV
eukprot:c23613_g1_i3 orf=509-1507(-)